MRKILLATLALSMLAVPVAQAGPRDFDARGHGIHHKHQPPKHWGRNDHRGNWQAPRPQTAKPHWKRGQHVSQWQRKQVVRDWHRHGLRRPGHGQEWLRVGNDYLLVSIASGIIAGLIAAR